MKLDEIIPGQVYRCASDDVQILSCRARVKRIENGEVLIQEIGSMLPNAPRPRWVHPLHVMELVRAEEYRLDERGRHVRVRR